jgi:hypothetical protein
MFYRAQRIEGKTLLVTGDGFAYRESSMRVAQEKADKMNRLLLAGIFVGIASGHARMTLAAELKAQRKERDAANRHASPSFL